MADYSMGTETPPEHPGWANVKSKVPRLPREEVLYRDKSTPRAVKQAVWMLQQNKVSWMEKLVQNISRPGNVVMHFCAGSCTTAKACMFPE